ncbi:hypothetical protein [Pseudopedobacter beijingensis]|uniref:Uncharacterized protein n=1 Tax=Pseudopedobacter beijingensis TaxID=1207056 RepID=A0ABW4IEH6_9SPHI
MEENYENLGGEENSEESQLNTHADIQFDSTIKGYVSEITKWGKLMAICGFIAAGFMVLAGVLLLFMGSMQAIARLFPGFGGLLGAIYIVMGVVYYFPAKYLYDFVVYARQALQFNDQESITYAFLRLKSHYRFIGIMIIVMICLYFLIFVAAFIGGMSSVIGGAGAHI